MNLFKRKMSLILVLIMLCNICAIPVFAVDSHGAELIAGDSFALAINSDGDILAWGHNSSGQLGDGDSGYSVTTPTMINTLSDVRKIVAGYETTLVLQNDGDVYGMGDSGYYQLAMSTMEVTTPTFINQLSDISDIALGSEHGVALSDDGDIYTWGTNAYGQLGDGSDYDLEDPEMIESFDDEIINVYANGYNTYAVNSSGEVWAWGDNDQLQLGTDSVSLSMEPLLVSGIDSVSKLVPAYTHVVALKEDGTIWTWGDNDRGQLGDGTQDDSPIPQQVEGLENIVDISAGDAHTMAIDSSGQLYTWGAVDLSKGSRGDVEYLEPVAVDDMDNIAKISSNGYFNLALASDGMVWSWGYNGNGQLGDGTKISNDTPQEIDLQLCDSIDLLDDNLPEGQDSDLCIPKNVDYVFSADDFPYSHDDDIELECIVIDYHDGYGTFEYDGEQLDSEDEIWIEDE